MGSTKFRFRTAAEIASEGGEAVGWIAKPYVACGVITDLEGKAKLAGKTTFLLKGLVRPVLTGADFLGCPTVPTPVVYLTEERPGTFLEALKRAGLSEREDLWILFWHETLGQRFSEVVEAAAEKCHQVGAKLLIVDTVNQFAGFRDDQENFSGPVLEAMEPLQKAASQGIGIITGRHARKAGGPVGESGRGSTAFTGAADIVLSLRRPEGKAPEEVRELHALSRFTETPPLLVIELTPSDYVSHGTQADVTAQRTKTAILATLPATEADAMSLDDLCMVMPMDLNARTTVQRGLEELVERGNVKKIGRGVKGDPYRFLRFIPPEPSQ